MKVFGHQGQINIIGTTQAVYFSNGPHNIKGCSHIMKTALMQKEPDVLKCLNYLSKVLPKEDFQKVLLLFSALYKRDRETALHSARVCLGAIAVGEKCNLSQEETVCVAVAALLHDIGKLEFSDSLFTSKALLTTLEKGQIRKHPDYGAVIVEKSGLGHCPGLIKAIRGHHERRDGSGYPDGKRRDQNPFLAEILATVDTRDGMENDRSYKKKLPPSVARQQMRDLGKQGKLNLALVEVFEEILPH
jgi:HD-GYP domain-containing protein (c-di-GMP phosphodiesterase class II)